MYVIIAINCTEHRILTWLLEHFLSVPSQPRAYEGERRLDSKGEGASVIQGEVELLSWVEKEDRWPAEGMR